MARKKKNEAFDPNKAPQEYSVEDEDEYNDADEVSSVGSDEDMAQAPSIDDELFKLLENLRGKGNTTSKQKKNKKYVDEEISYDDDMEDDSDLESLPSSEDMDDDDLAEIQNMSVYDDDEEEEEEEEEQTNHVEDNVEEEEEKEEEPKKPKMSIDELRKHMVEDDDEDDAFLEVVEMNQDEKEKMDKEYEAYASKEKEKDRKEIANQALDRISKNHHLNEEEQFLRQYLLKAKNIKDTSWDNPTEESSKMDFSFDTRKLIITPIGFEKEKKTSKKTLKTRERRKKKQQQKLEQEKHVEEERQRRIVQVAELILQLQSVLPKDDTSALNQLKLDNVNYENAEKLIAMIDVNAIVDEIMYPNHVDESKTTTDELDIRRNLWLALNNYNTTAEDLMEFQFKYKRVAKEDFGLSIEDILEKEDDELDKMVPIQRVMAFDNQENTEYMEHLDNMRKRKSKHSFRNRHLMAKKKRKKRPVSTGNDELLNNPKPPKIQKVVEEPQPTKKTRRGRRGGRKNKK